MQALSQHDATLLEKGIQELTSTLQWLKDPGRDLHYFVASVLGLYAYIQLPVLKLKQTGQYIDWVKASDMNAPVMIGVTEAGRVFVALRYVNRLSKNPTEQKVEVVFQRSIGQPDVRSATCYSESLFYGNAVYWDDLKRLLKHEPCGRRNASDGEEGPKTTDDGKPVIELQ